MEERSSSFFFWLCLRIGAARFLGSVLCLFAQGCMGEELDVGKCWDSSFGFFLSLCWRVVYIIGENRLLGLFPANSSLGFLLESSTSRSFLGKCAGFVCCKTGEGAIASFPGRVDSKNNTTPI